MTLYRFYYDLTALKLLSPVEPNTNCLLRSGTRFVGTQDACNAKIAALNLAAYAPAQTPQQIFQAAVAAGYTVPDVTPALVLDLSDSAQAKFASLQVLLTAQLAAGRIALTDSQLILDQSGSPRVFAVSAVQTMLIGYGEYYLELLATLHGITSN